MLADSQKKEILQKILQSKEFEDSGIYAKLLSYLVNCSIEGKLPKETTIALEIFNKDAKFNPAEDSIVRYKIHNLRKKLQTYYLNEGKDDKIQIVIPKGHYKATFEVNNNKKISTPKGFTRRNSYLFVIPALFLLLCILFVILLIKYISLKEIAKPISQSDPIWSDFLNNHGRQNTIVFGDYFILKELRKDLNRRQEIRDYKVNSIDDLEKYKVETQNDSIYVPYFPMLPHHCPENLLDLLPVLGTVKPRVNVLLSSKLDLNSIRNNNLIYLGKFNNLRLLEKFIGNLRIKYQFLPGFIFITDDRNDTLETFARFRQASGQALVREPYFNVDYALVTKLRGPTKNTIWIFAGFGHISMIESVKEFTDPAKLSELEKTLKEKIGHVPKYFEMLFEVKGLKRTGFEVQIKFVREIGENYKLGL